MKANKKVLSVFSFFILATILLTFTGCPTSLQKIDGVEFQSSEMARIFSEIFAKDAALVTEEELAAIAEVNIITYTETNRFSIVFRGYEEANKLGLDTSSYFRYADISDMTLSDMRDMSFLTSLKRFTTTYVPFDNYDFLENCKELESFEILYNYETADYSVLSKLPKLKKVNIEGAVIEDLGAFSELSSVETLALNEISFADGREFDVSALLGLTNLSSLSLVSNGISDAKPFSGFTNLKRLDLARNSIEDVSPLASLVNLEYLNLEQNGLTDISSLTTFDSEKFDRLILDTNSFIEDWSYLDYLGDKVQGKPLTIKSYDLSKVYGTADGMVKKQLLEDVESVEFEKIEDKIHLTIGFSGYLEAYATQPAVPENLYKKIVLTEPIEEFCTHFDAFINLKSFISHGVDYKDFEFLHKTKLSLHIFEVVGNSIDADYSKLSELKNLVFVSVRESNLSNKDFFYTLEGLDQLILD
ncbi:MAG: leucine-rich repeat domain-containing protein [Ruminococcaceae bacterium]|nr:leucine-rich repeat domain-containing protein [Oscillospiraceae bacterium]